MIIKYINEGAFGSYKNKVNKEDKIAKLRDETSKIVKNAEKKEFIEGVRPFIDEIYDKCSHDVDTWFIRKNLCMDFVLDNKAKIGIDVVKGGEFGSDYTLIIGLPMHHLYENYIILDLFDKEGSYYDCLPILKERVRNYFMFNKDIIDYCKNNLKNETGKKELKIAVDVKFHLTNASVTYDNIVIEKAEDIKDFKKAENLLFGTFDNYYINCKRLTIKYNSLFEEKTFKKVIDALSDHFKCEEIYIHDCSNWITSLKGIEKFFNVNKAKVTLDFSRYFSQPGINLQDWAKPCSDELIWSITGMSYDELLIKNKLDVNMLNLNIPSRIEGDEEIEKYVLSKTTLRGIKFFMNKNGIIDAKYKPDIVYVA